MLSEPACTERETRETYNHITGGESADEGPG